MDQSPHPASGDSRLGNSDLSLHSEAASPENLTESSLETRVAPAPPPVNLNLNSAALSVLSRRYDILSEAGRGAMGQVYKARDRETGEIVALKLLKPDIASDPAMIERFKSELLFARRITHKNVCRVYEFNRVDGIAFTSMEFVEGESLRSVLKRFGSLTSRKGIDVALQMCAGLKEAHAQGIVHRDLKPENVMIDAQGNVKVMDFGIARSMQALTLLTGTMVGTPAYMAPEQAAGKAVDYRADIYALGLMLYEMFTGAPPFQADNAVALALKHMQEAPRSPREMDPAISEPMERAILKCLAKEPEKRFQSVAELEDALGSQAPASARDRSTTPFATRSAKIPEGASFVAKTAANAAAAPKASHAIVVAAVVVAGIVALGGGMFWRERTKQKRSFMENALQVNRASPSALAVPAATAAVSPAPSPAATDPAKAGQPATPKPKKLARSPLVEAHAPAHSAQASSSVPPQAASASSSLTESASAPASAAASAPGTQPAPNNDNEPAGRGRGGYVFVSRFPREVGAQNAARRIEEMGLSVTIIPKHNALTGEDFFVVLSGPYKPAKIGGIVEQLKAKGFAQARRNNPVAGAANAAARPSSAPAP
jgi:serine/threonine protein kinase